MGLEEFLREAKAIVGDEWVLTDPWDLVAYERDYWPLLIARDVRGEEAWPRPAAAVLPGGEEEVLEILESALRHSVCLVPYAGGTGVLGGALAGPECVVLDVARLDWIRWLDEEAGVVEAGAGAPLRAVEEWLNDRGWTLRHYPQSYPNALIGGLIATRSTGQYSTGYGGIEDRVKGLRVAVPGLGLVVVPPAPRRSLLLPLEQLFTGSEGMLGVITSAYIEALPEPECSLPLALGYESFWDALADARALVQKGLAPELYRVYDELETQTMFGGSGSLAIAVVEGDCMLVEARLEIYKRILRGKLLDSGPAEDWLRERFNVVKVLRDLYKAGMAFDTIEVSATWSRLKPVYEAVKEALLGLEGVYYVSAHASHFYPSGAALYFTVAFDLSRADSVYDAIWDKALRATSSAGGSIGHHHGVGLHRLRWLELEYGRAGVELMRRIKEALDPKGVLRGRWPRSPG